MRELVIVRGLPGSGKTTLAKRFEVCGYVHCEADHHFEVAGEYKFDASKLLEAHAECLRKATEAMDAGRPVVVSNTFTRVSEAAPYLDHAKSLGYAVRIVKLVGSYGSIHQVPAITISNMAARWEDIEGEEPE